MVSGPGELAKIIIKIKEPIMTEGTSVYGAEQTENQTETAEDKKMAVVVRPTHFIILSIASFGLYNLWWMYKSWRYIKYNENGDIHPALRALFTLFFGHQLFTKIAYYSATRGYHAAYNPTVVLLAYIGLNFLGRLPEPFWLLSILSFIPLLGPVRAFNFYFTGDAEASQSEFNNRKFFLVAIGVIFWLLLALGMLMGTHKSSY
jgi:hypothetical protein